MDRRTPEEIDRALRDGISLRDPTTDVETDFVPQVVTGPTAEVLSDLQGDIVDVLSVVSVQDADAFRGGLEDELDRRLLDEGIIPGGQETSTVVLTAFRSAAPTADMLVRRGEPIGTAPGVGTGQQIVFVAAETVRLPFASASTYFSLARRRYELNFLATATVAGASGVVGAKTVTKPLRSSEWDGFENLSASSPASDGESIERKIERWNLSIVGEQISTRAGLLKSIFERFAGRVFDAKAVGVSSGYVTRASNLGSPVDCYIVGETLATSTETYPFLGRGQLIAVAFSPLVGVSQVRDVAGGVTYVEGTDYVVVPGTSTLDVCGIYFNATGSVPAAGVGVTITYDYDALNRELQETYASDALEADGRDLLFVRATEVPIALSLTMTVKPNFDANAAKALARSKVLTAYARGKLGVTVEMSDIDVTARKVPALGNVIFNRLSRADVPTGAADIPMAPFEYETLDASNFATP